jgi:peptide/nickel transport system substrate-binding protein
MEYGQAASLDPATDNAYDSASYETLQACYDTLFGFTGSDVSTPTPLLATGFSVSADGLVYTITLHPNVTYHSGAACNASTVKYSLDRFFLIDNGPAYSNFANDVKGYTTYDATGSKTTQADVDAFLGAGGITVINETALKITLDAPDASFIKKLTFVATSIINPAFDKANGGFNATGHTGNDYMVTHEDGTGPFTLGSFEHLQSITLNRYANYFRGPAAPAKVIIQDVEDYNTRLLALQKGDADIITMDSIHTTDVANDSRIVLDTSVPSLAVGCFYFNQLDWPFTDVRVRQAFTESFDKDTYVATATNGLGWRIDSCVPKPLVGSNPLAQQAFNLTDAKLKLQDAGFTASNATTITINYNSGNDNRKRACLMLKQNIESLGVGITINVQEMTWAEYIAAMNAKQLPFYYVGWQADYPGADNFISAFLWSHGYYPVKNSWPGNATADTLFAQALATTDSAKQNDLYNQITTVTNLQFPYIYAYQTPLIVCYNKNLKGVVPNAMNGGLFVQFNTMYK